MIFVVAQKLSGIAVADVGEGRPPPTPYFEPKVRPEGPKKILGACLSPPPPPHPLSEGLHPPLYSINIVLKTIT